MPTPNFVGGGLKTVALVLDATEVQVERVWQTDAAHVLSNYKGKPTTAKVIIGITPYATYRTYSVVG